MNIATLWIDVFCYSLGVIMAWLFGFITDQMAMAVMINTIVFAFGVSLNTLGGPSDG